MKTLWKEYGQTVITVLVAAMLLILCLWGFRIIGSGMERPAAGADVGNNKDGKELKIEITDIRNQAGKTVEDIYEKAGIYEIEVRAEDAYEKQTVSRFRIPVNGGGI